MQLGNLRQEHQNKQGQSAMLVSALGFGTAIEEKFKQLFQQNRPGKQIFSLVPSTELGINILLVNYDNPLALRKKDILVNGLCANAEIVAVSQMPLQDAPQHHIRGMLTASRLMAVLDKISLPATPASVTVLSPTPKLELVQAPVKSTETIASNAASLAGEVKTPAQYRVLVVDDSIAIQKSLEIKLTALEQIAGIDFAESGEAALAMAASNPYQLIFLDVMMPGMDGYETCTRLRKNPEYKKTPIIMVSGKTSPLDEVKGIMAGCTTYLTKPVQDEAFQKLSIRVLAWLSDRKTNAKAAH